MRHNFLSPYVLYSGEEKLRLGEEDDEAIYLVDKLLFQAVKIGASDIHFEPEESGARVRYRIDGTLYEMDHLASDLISSVIVRMKILANMDITETRRPQDGKVQIKYYPSVEDLSFLVDLRLSTYPSLYGEKVVVRILKKKEDFLSLDKLGMQPQVLSQLLKIIERENGFFLVTGPTGSGKTTTLYAILSHLNKAEKNIMTMEDPVEYRIKGVTQGQINRRIGFEFKDGLRAILRQDPDIIMVGEIRDKETCRISLESALTGQMVLSTLHTKNSVGVISRLFDMGIESFLLNATLSAVLAQRLLRLLCPYCKKKVSLTDDEKMKLKEKYGFTLNYSYVPEGCKKCFNLGYRGRIGIFELLEIDEELRDLIRSKSFSVEELIKLAKVKGMLLMKEDAFLKIQAGLVSLVDFLNLDVD